MISERGPLDFVAYLTALEQLGRSDGELIARATTIADASLTDVDLVVLLPLDDRHPIRVPIDEDPALRDAMDAALLDLADEREGAGAPASSRWAETRRRDCATCSRPRTPSRSQTTATPSFQTARTSGTPGR